MTRISITVDGVRYDDDVAPRTLLVTHLRETLGKVGTVIGCDTSSCGACTVLMSDPAGDASDPGGDASGQGGGGRGRQVAVKSCNVLAVQADGCAVTTIEGLSGPDGTLHPVQHAFRDRHALQCGYCTPGMIMAAVDLLTDNPDPADTEIREGLEGNLCRCTGYQNIVRAVRDAAAELRTDGERTDPTDTATGPGNRGPGTTGVGTTGVGTTGVGAGSAGAVREALPDHDQRAQPVPDEVIPQPVP